jgi:hypothetical protein
MNEVEVVLEELANRFGMAGDDVWTGAQVAEVLRQYMHDRDTEIDAEIGDNDNGDAA